MKKIVNDSVHGGFIPQQIVNVSNAKELAKVTNSIEQEVYIDKISLDYKF